MNSHNIIALVAAIRRTLANTRVVTGPGLVWVVPGAIGIAGYWLLLVVLHTVFHFQLGLTAMLVATLTAVLIAASTYKLHHYLLARRTKAVQEQSHYYCRELFDLADKLRSVLSLRQQGGELLTLITKAVGGRRACLLFSEVGSEDFTAQFVEPQGQDNPLSSLKLGGQSAIVKYLGREQKLLTRENLAALPEFPSLTEPEKEEIKSNEIELLVPLISHDRVTGVLVLDKKQSGKYTPEDFNLLENTSNQITISIEKEYLRELRKREEELSAIDRSSAIIASSLDIQKIYDSFVEELKKVVDVSWAAIVLIEDEDFYFLALSPEADSASREAFPATGTAIKWMATHKKTIVESDLLRESRFVTGEYHLKQGIRSIAYVPLMGKSGCIGSLVVASRKPNVYGQRQTMLLEQLASQIALPVENSRLYVKAEEKARIDDVTGLLNRRALDEMITNEIARHSRYGDVLSLIILDLDSFKAFNDSYGHLAGDKLLRQIGSILKRAIRSADQAFRYGGDEFAILLPQTTAEAANDVAERVRQRVVAEVEAGPIPITASLGLATWPINGTRPNEIISAADAALYHAKRSGGNQSRCALGVVPTPDDVTVGYGSDKGNVALSTIFALAATMDTMGNYTRDHSKKVKEHVVALAKVLSLEPLAINRLETCALLHDIGKVSVSDKILEKQDKLTTEEWEVIKSHPQAGANIVSHVRSLAPCIPGILNHHERYDGSGYPQGLKGEEIPLDARMLAIADAFVAMTSDRPYCDAIPIDRALQEIRKGAGTQFDPNLVDNFLITARDYPATSAGGVRR